MSEIKPVQPPTPIDPDPKPRRETPEPAKKPGEKSDFEKELEQVPDPKKPSGLGVETDMDAAMALAGFERVSTGGGCETYLLRKGVNDICITNEDSQAPRDFGERVWLTHMRQGEIIYEQREGNVGTALMLVGAWIYGGAFAWRVE